MKRLSDVNSETYIDFDIMIQNTLKLRLAFLCESNSIKTYFQKVLVYEFLRTNLLSD